MRIVAKFFSEVVEVSGKTQRVENIKTNSKYWREQIIGDLQYPSALDEWYTPEPNTAHAFLAMLKERKEYYLSHGSGQNHVELLEMEDVAPMPYDEPFTGEPGDHVRVVALLDGQRVEVSGATNKIATMIAPPELYKRLRVEMRKPREPDTIRGFCWIVSTMYGRDCKFLVQQNLPDYPYDPNAVY